MKKKELIKITIKKHEEEIKRLKELLHLVDGDVTEVCPVCRTKNLHWKVNNTKTCAFC